MPQRVFCGKDDSVFGHRESDNSVREIWAQFDRAHRSATKNRHPLRAPIEALESRVLLSTSWFVSPSGSDQNAGTLAKPFRTIQHAADLAEAGDHVEIEAGTYREDVKPGNSGSAGAPIVFEAYNGQQVTISGADPITGWTNYKNQIYQASMPWTLGEGNDQVFVDGRMINEARFPNTSLDVSHPTLGTAQNVTISGNYATLYDPALTQSAGFWVGAVIHITPGQQWIAQTGTVTASSPGHLNFKFIPLDSYELPTAGNQYYLTGTFKGLDSAGEWYRGPGGTLSVWTPGSDNPANHDVEAKHRDFAFDVSGESYITIQNINIFAATINSNAASSHLVVNHISARYVGQFVLNPQGWTVPSNSGILLAGNASVMENSTIAFGAGDGVLVTGANSRISNNTIHDVGYSAADTAGIRITGAGTEVDHNTIYNTGRSGIRHTAARLKILYNVIHDAGLQTTEAGGIYTVDTNGQGTEIAYNQIYNMHSGGYGNTAVFLDNNSSNFVVDHNQVWNVDAALKLNYVCRNDSIYNNTFEGSQFSVFTNGKGDWDGTTVTKNVLPGKTKYTTGASVFNNAIAAADGVGAGTFVSGSSATLVNVGATGSGGTSTPPSGGSGNSSNGSGSTSNGGGSSSTGSSSGSGSSGSSGGAGTTPVTTPTPTPVPTPAPTPTPVPVTPPVPVGPPDYPVLLATDRAALRTAQLTRTQRLAALSITLAGDEKTYRAVQGQLRVAQRVARKASKNPASAATAALDVTTLSAELRNLIETVARDHAALILAHHIDFTGIAAARKLLNSDQKAFARSKHSK